MIATLAAVLLAAGPQQKAGPSSPIDLLRLAGWSVEVAPEGTPYRAIAIGPPKSAPSVVTLADLPAGAWDALSSTSAAARLSSALAASAGPIEILQVSPPRAGRGWEIAAILTAEKPPRLVQFFVVQGEPGHLVTLVTTKGLAEKAADEVRSRLVRGLSLSTRKE